MSKTKPVKLPVEVVDQLERIKKTLGLRSLGEASEVLMDISFSPLSVIALALDIRNDIKKLNENLEQLNKNLETLVSRLPKQVE